MADLTITEALAETKTIDARIVKKREFIASSLYRQEQLKDPFEKQGGAVAVISQERQSIADLSERKIQLRRAIQVANESTQVTIGKTTRSISDWLIWRREVAPGLKDMLASFATGIRTIRAEAQRKGMAIVTTGDLAQKPTDLILHIDEKQLAEQIEDLELVLGQLDGQLSLKNATTVVVL